MKLIIAGSRTLCPDLGFIRSAIHMLHITKNSPITEVVCGGAEGVDNEGQHWASHHDVPIKMMCADWDKHGKAAGPIRNKQMAEYGDALLLIWDGESRGSHNMRKEMAKLRKPIYEVVILSK